ncbi:hypothetical protein [Desulfonatronospira sp.]|uniref:hypothetical protein n=1 Tax=Desulfonatronospira sp. TaxID=1962951 RepID=UPI0025C5609F|nr:hypothetical protein [Desulfonatronospira sp.]
MKQKFLFYVLLLSFLICTPDRAFAEDSEGLQDQKERKWSLTLSSGIYTDRTVGQAIFNIPGRLESNYMHSLAVARQMGGFWDHFSWELEGMFAKHHGKHKTGRQDYEEFVAALLIRYHTFPWDQWLDTTLAVGSGVSATTETPKRELQTDRGKSQNILNYLAFELELTWPKFPNTSLTYRIHHRSGVFGLYGGVEGASDFYLLGLRWRF